MIIVSTDVNNGSNFLSAQLRDHRLAHVGSL
jgi:hypothetical protein